MRGVTGFLLLGFMTVAVDTTAAPPETRCRVSGAYIKLYGKTEAANRETCERQGGELADYTAPAAHSGPDRSGVQSDMGRSRSGAGSLFK